MVVATVSAPVAGMTTAVITSAAVARVIVAAAGVARRSKSGHMELDQ
jgi:hypothetical protein